MSNTIVSKDVYFYRNARKYSSKKFGKIPVLYFLLLSERIYNDFVIIRNARDFRHPEIVWLAVTPQNSKYYYKIRKICLETLRFLCLRNQSRFSDWSPRSTAPRKPSAPLGYDTTVDKGRILGGRRGRSPLNPYLRNRLYEYVRYALQMFLMWIILYRNQITRDCEY
jgi:hypothetical protein